MHSFQLGLSALLFSLFALPVTAQNSFQNFEGFSAPLANGSVLFRLPTTFDGTSSYLNRVAGSPNEARLTVLLLDPDSRAYSGQNAVRVSFEFAPNAPARWLNLTTLDTENLPNPTIPFANGFVEFKVFVEGTEDIYMTLGARETNTSAALGADGGTSGEVEWIGAAELRNTEPLGKRVTAGQWQTVRFFIPQEPKLPFSANADGVLTGAKGTFAHLAITPVNPNAQSAFMLSFDDLLIGNLAVINGIVTIDGRFDSSVPLNYELVPQDGSPTITGVTIPDVFGSYAITNVPPKIYTLFLKTSNTLRRRIDNVDAFSGNPNLNSAFLRGGDANDDNAVDISDLILLIQHYNQRDGAPGSTYLEASDFIFDGSNDISDLELLIFYYNQFGD